MPVLMLVATHSEATRRRTGVSKSFVDNVLPTFAKVMSQLQEMREETVESVVREETVENVENVNVVKEGSVNADVVSVVNVNVVRDRREKEGGLPPRILSSSCHASRMDVITAS